MFQEKSRAVILISSKASPKSGKVILCQLDGPKIHENMDQNKLIKLEVHIIDVMKEFDTLTGINENNVGKGTNI